MASTDASSSSSTLEVETLPTTASASCDGCISRSRVGYAYSVH